jgi:glycosyltransferase involved in cell wall biosynthesis
VGALPRGRLNHLRGDAPPEPVTTATLRICYFGTYERDYPRNAQVISCLRRAGVTVDEVHVPVWERERHRWNAGAIAAARLALAETELFTRKARDCDALIVGYPGHFDLPAARRAAKGRPIVFNPLVSLADTFVADRRRFPAHSLAARLLETADRRAFAAANLVVADTRAHANFFATLAQTPVEVCFVGAEERVFRPGWKPLAEFTVLFVGKLIPLHGVDVVLAAALLAPELRFRIVGTGQLQHLLADRPANVEHVPWVEYERLPEELYRASCALGIFGTTAKAQRVIPNKAFQALACATPLVTADTPAAHELLVDGQSALLVPPGDPAALAEALRRLAADAELSGTLSVKGRAVFEARASESVLGERWRGIIERLL